MKGPRPKPSQTPLLVGRGYPQQIDLVYAEDILHSGPV